MLAWPPLPLALAPRRTDPRCSRIDAIRLLEVEKTIAAGLAVRAIAEGWDTGRIALPDGGLAREGEVFALLGIAQDLAPRHVEEAHRMLDAVVAQGRELAAAIPQLSPMDEIVDEFGLSYLARMILSLVAAPQIWGEIARLYTIAASDPKREVIDQHLLRLLLGPRHVSPHDLAQELAVNRPLRRCGLVHVTSKASAQFAGLVVDPIIVERLRGNPLVTDPFGELPIVRDPLPLDQLRLPPAVAAQLRAAIARPTARPFRIVVRGRDGSGRRTLLASLAAHANRRLATIHIYQLDDRVALDAELRRVLARCTLAGWLPCIDGLDTIAADDRVTRDRVCRVIADHPDPLAIRIDRDAQAPIDAGYLQIDLPDLSETERLGAWAHELDAHGVASEVDVLAPLAARWRVGPGTIHRVVAHITESAGAEVSRGTIDQAVSQTLELRLGTVAEKLHRLPRLADMVLPSDVQESLAEFLARLQLSRKVFEDWGMTKVATTGRGITALFSGPPGTGKTMVASALAHELGLDLYRVDLSRVMSKYIGETEKNLGSVFSAAEESQAIILFDEADSLFTKRTEVKSSNDRFANLEVNYLLQRLDTFVGIAILTTNLATSIDPAFMRRLAFRVHFPIPDEELREQLWRAHLPPTIPTQGDLDLAELAQEYPLTGGSVRNCVLRAAFLAAAEAAPIGQEHLHRAVKLEYRAAGKLSESGPLE